MQAETSLVRSEPSSTISLSEWNRERIDLVKKSVCPSGISDSEFALFMEVCKRSGLDPLTKEIFCVPRRLNIGSRDNPKWVVKHEAQPAEAGILARADRFPDFGGIKAAAYYEGDDITVTDAGVVHKFNPAKRSGKLLGAWAQAFREGRVLPVELVSMSAYQQNTTQWSQKPETMIVKCARAAALRRAYPNAFSGLYLREEMPEEEFDVPAEQKKEKPRRVAEVTVETKALPVVSPAPSPAPKPECAPGTHEWSLEGKCLNCGKLEKPTQSPALRARVIRVWKDAQARGMSADAFQKWVTGVLGAEKNSADWGEAEVELLEVATKHAKPAERSPGEEG